MHNSSDTVQGWPIAAAPPQLSRAFSLAPAHAGGARGAAQSTAAHSAWRRGAARGAPPPHPVRNVKRSCICGKATKVQLTD